MSINQLYESFIDRKRKQTPDMGFEVKPWRLNSSMFDWQSIVTQFGIRRGRSAFFAECGLGKTLMQLAWAEQVVRHTNRPVMIHTPLGVRAQTAREAAKFNIGVAVKIVNDASEVIRDGINLVNYEKLKHFDPNVFAGVVLDESSVLKNSAGKIKKQLVETYSRTPYRLACTATPAPNDHMELGSHAEFLGICQREDMLSKYFVHDGSDTSKWRLRGHAAKHFWEWVATWAVCISKPSDVGGDDTGYDLPPLDVRRHIVEVDTNDAPNGYLFNPSGLTATSIHEEKRLTCDARCDRVAELLSGHTGSAVIWCDTNYESDALLQRINAVEIRGTDKEATKEERLIAFANGEDPVLITKPSVAGFGMNWQHCNRQIFAGLSYSFESYYQAVRRCWRFGQTQPVVVDIVLADSESAITSAVARKETDHLVMRSEMAKAMRDATVAELGIVADRGKSAYQPSVSINVPSFLSMESSRAS